MKNTLCFLLLFTTIACKDSEVKPKEYPYILMDEVKTNSSGATFIAKIISLGDSPFLEYGFIWYKESKDDSLNQFKWGIGESIGLGEFSLNVTSDLAKDENFVVLPFVKTTKFIVFGDAISFRSMGSSSPIIEDFSPKIGSSGDTITVKGDNFSVNRNRNIILIGDDSAKVISSNFKEIKFILPQKLSISGNVSLSLISGGKAIYAKNTFLVDGHKIYSFTPQKGIIGETEIIIKGDRFLNTGNKVKIGLYDANIIKENESEITIKLPYRMPVGENNIKVIAAGKEAISENIFLTESRWERLNDFPGITTIGGYFGIIDNYGYLICGANGDFSDYINKIWKYDFSTDEWELCGTFPGPPRAKGVGFTIGDKIYYGMGWKDYETFSDFWEFTPESGNWKQLDSFPDTPIYDAIQFTINNKGYLIGGLGTWSNLSILEFDPLNDTWNHFGDVSYTIAQILDGRDLFCQTNSNAYFSPITTPRKKALFEFDPTRADFISELSEFSFSPNKNGFVIGNDIFLGSNDRIWSESYKDPDFWKYNLVTKEWVGVESFLGGQNPFINVASTNNFVYVLYETNSKTQLWRYNSIK